MKQIILLAALFFSLQQIQAQQNDSLACACCSEVHQQFSFWLGDWEVFDAKDSLIGTNLIVSLQDSCILQENWKSGVSFSGSSYNFYNQATEKWQQLWVDNQGGSLELSGGLENGNMILSSDSLVSKKGMKYVNRVIWSPNSDGSVEQTWDIVGADGEVKQTVFYGKYKRKE